MIQLKKSYTHNGKKFPIGQKIQFDPVIEKRLIEQGIGVLTSWDGTIKKAKTNFFKPKK